MGNEKTYTEQEVTKMINDNLANYKKQVEADLAERETTLKQKEFEYEAKRLLQEKGFSESFIKILKGDNIETFTGSVEALAAYRDTRVETHREGIDSGTSKGYYNSSQYTHNAGIRGAMGLK